MTHTNQESGDATQQRLGGTRRGVMLLAAFLMASTGLVAGIAGTASAAAPLPLENPATATCADAAGSGSITVSFSKPIPSDNVAGYKITIRDAADTVQLFDPVFVAGADTLSVTILGLTDGTGYRFRVESVNAEGAVNGPRPDAVTATACTPGPDPGPVIGTRYVFPTVDAEIRQHFMDFLDRQPNFSELVFWREYFRTHPEQCRFGGNPATTDCPNSGRGYDLISFLRTGLLPRGGEVFNSADYFQENPNTYQGVVNPIIRLYFAYFDRIPDMGGLEYWSDKIRDGSKSLDAISDFFAHSSEFINTYGDLSDSDFVTLVYFNVLDRAPDFGGQNFWVGQLQGGRTRGYVMTRFSESNENIRKLRFDTAVINTYTGLLRRLPTADELFAGRAYIENGGNAINIGNRGRIFTARIRNSQEYKARFV